MLGPLTYLFIALVISALCGSPWVFIVAVVFLIIYCIIGLFGLIALPGETTSTKCSSKDNSLPDYVMFDDLDDI
jgi:hypothetical protein